MPLKIKDDGKEIELFPSDWKSVNIDDGLTLVSKDGSKKMPEK